MKLRKLATVAALVAVSASTLVAGNALAQGAHAAVENATRIGKQIASQLKIAGVTGVILTST